MLNYSFIIPHHNSPHLLNRCLDSIPLREDIEVIVVDDNSDSDKMPQVTRPNVKLLYIDAEHSKGAGRARNYALKEARGKWLVFADADDFYTPGFINILDKYKESNYDVVYYNIDSVDSETLLKANRDQLLKNLICNYNGSKKSLDAIKYKVHAPWDKMVMSSFVLKYDIYFEEVLKGNDTLFGFLVGFFVIFKWIISIFE